MSKQPTKAQRWQEAIDAARTAASKAENVQEQLREAKQEVVDALDALRDMAQEFGEPYDNMSEGLQQTPFGQKCEAMQNLDLDGADVDDELDELVSKIDEAEGAEIPLGFGRD